MCVYLSVVITFRGSSSTRASLTVSSLHSCHPAVDDIVLERDRVRLAAKTYRGRPLATDNTGTKTAWLEFTNQDVVSSRLHRA